MIFTPFGTALDTKNYGKLQATIFGKSYSDIAENGLLGNTSQLTSDIDNARTALEKFFAGTNEQRGSLEYLNDCIKDTSAEFKNYVGTLDMTHASLQSLQSILDGFASSQGFVAKAMTLVQNVGLKLLTTFGSMAITFAVSAAINALVKHFIELAQAEEKARDAAIDSGKELDAGHRVQVVVGQQADAQLLAQQHQHTGSAHHCDERDGQRHTGKSGGQVQ